MASDKEMEVIIMQGSNKYISYYIILSYIVVDYMMVNGQTIKKMDEESIHYLTVELLKEYFIMTNLYLSLINR